jgi:ATP-binding cassette, subfamily B, bacterial
MVAQDKQNEVRSTEAQQRIPEELTDVLVRDGLTPEAVREAGCADLTPDGRFGEEWLLVIDGRILVYSRAEAEDCWTCREDLALLAARNAEMKLLTCGGELSVEVGGLPRRLVLFSAARVDEFAALAPRLGAMAEGREGELDEGSEQSRSSKCEQCGRAMEPGTETCPHCTGKGRVLWRLVGLVLPYRRSVAAILTLLLVGVSIGLVPPYLVRALVDGVLIGGKHPEWLLPLVLAIFGLHGVRAVINMVHGRLAVRVGSRLTTDLRRRLFSHLTGLSISFFDRTQVGRLMTRVAQDTEELHVFISQALNGFLVPGVMAIGITAMLFHLNAALALYVLLPLPLVAVATCLFYKSITPRHERYWKARSRVNAFLNTCFSGIRVVKAFGQEGREGARFTEYNDALRAGRISVDQVWAVFFPGVLLAFQASGLMVWYFGGGRVLAGEISLGTLMAFLGYLAMLHGPLSVLSQLGQWLTRSLTSAQRIFEMLDRRPEIREPQNPQPLEGFRGEIEFRNVSFGYLPNQPVIRDVSFTVQPGEVVGVVGRSGAGKTTLAGLTARFYDPQKGQVLLDGCDVRNMASADLRRHVGLVLQEPFIFRGSISENIGYGKPSAGRDAVLRAAAAADCHEFVSNMPLGYDSQVGERGAGLSGGEKQRVSIGRAILHDPEVLILDEATSSLDTEAERVIHQALGKLVEGRTTIIIAHRLVTLRGCDRILVMDRGRLVESGPHGELMQVPGGIYRGLVESQERAPREAKSRKVTAA